jgi:hypothetical protein
MERHQEDIASADCDTTHRVVEVVQITIAHNVVHTVR